MAWNFHTQVSVHWSRFSPRFKGKQNVSYTNVGMQNCWVPPKMSSLLRSFAIRKISQVSSRTRGCTQSRGSP